MRNKEFVTEQLNQSYNMLLLLEQDLEAGRLKNIGETIERLKRITDRVLSANNRVQLEQSDSY